MTGGCDCNNIQVTWQTVDYSVIPRACHCEYCLSRHAAYVSKSGTRFVALIRNEDLHARVQHGSRTAVFHECVNCQQVVFVTAEIDGDIYGAMNANLLNNKLGFLSPVETNFGSQTAEQKRERWQQNWCHPVEITSRAGGDA